jgi:hypothetical protein
MKNPALTGGVSLQFKLRLMDIKGSGVFSDYHWTPGKKRD